LRRPTAVEEALNTEAKRGMKYLCKPGLILRRQRGTAVEEVLIMDAKRV
jgi:hypothetical protein